MSRRAHERKPKAPYPALPGERVRVDCEPPLSGEVLQVRGDEALVQWWRGEDWFLLTDLRSAGPPAAAGER